MSKKAITNTWLARVRKVSCIFFHDETPLIDENSTLRDDRLQPDNTLQLAFEREDTVSPVCNSGHVGVHHNVLH